MTLTVTQTASAAGTLVPGLWSSTYTAAVTDCGSFSRDTNNFCWTEGGDGNLAGPGVELGVKFTSSQNMSITGIRVYRVSPGAVTGHLWDGAGGQPLATGTFSGSQYSYVWKTSSNWAGTCRSFDLGRNDGRTHTFLVEFKK